MRRWRTKCGRLASLVLLFVATLCVIGCDDPQKSAASKPSGVPTPMGSGVVAGTVTFRGTVPPGEQVPLTSDCHHGSGTVEVKPVIADGEGKLRDVVVTLKGAVGGAKDAPPLGGPVVLDQIGCEYVPHVVALRVGQVLRVKSSDPTAHNVHGLADRNQPFNFGIDRESPYLLTAWPSFRALVRNADVDWVVAMQSRVAQTHATGTLTTADDPL